MSLVDHVVLAADFSEPSKVALRATLALLEVTRAKRATILYAAREVVVPGAGEGTEQLRERLEVMKQGIEDGARRAMAELLATMPPAPCPIEIAVVHGKPARVIPPAAKALGATLIVLGTHARRGLRRMVMGSITESMLAGVEVPTLVTHTGDDGRGPDEELRAVARVLVAVDVDRHADAVVRTGLQAAALFPVRPAVTLLAVADLPSVVAAELSESPDALPDAELLRQHAAETLARTLDALVAAVEGSGVALEPQVAEGDAAEEILRAAEELDAKLIVVGHRGSGAASFFDLGSTAADVVRHANVSVLVVPSHDRA
ncbi:universal stress protein [Myxococcota bacterium]|nr:universal stress protein [Myxococcota bacterium]